MKKIFIGVMIVISFVFVVKISYVQTQNIMGDETSQEENCEQLSWTLKNGILIISAFLYKNSSTQCYVLVNFLFFMMQETTFLM